MMADYDIHGGAEDDDNDGGLENQSWYWGKMDREEAKRILMAKDHGHFLVRDSTTKGEYTLVVRRMERVCNIRILRGEDGRYGVVENQCHFGAVDDLIMFLMEHPRFLHQHFSHIDLIYPMSKPEATVSSTRELLYQLVLRNKDLILHNDRYVSYVKDRKFTLQEIAQLKKQVTSLSVVLSLFEEQLGLLNAELSSEFMMPNTPGGGHSNSTSLGQNRAVIQERTAEMRGRLHEAERQQKELTTMAHRQLDAIHQLRPVLSHMQQEVTFLRLRMEERGLKRDYLDLLLKDDKDTDLSHYDPQNWRVQCNREEAERQLSQCVPGTFLVRPGMNGGYVLSISRRMSDDKVDTRHCKIHMDPQRLQYGFHVDYCIFCSVEELVRKHQNISLKFYNKSLDVCLTYPVNYNTNISHGEPPRV